MAKAKILVVDDEAYTRVFFYELLKEKGYKVSIVEDGRRAIETAKKGSFDLVFLDVRMPDIDGVETCKAIKKTSPKTIVIMMSGYPVEDEVREALKLGASDYVAKPFNPDEIMGITQVAEYLNIHRMTLYDLVRTRKIPAFKVGGQWRFRKELLEKWITTETKRREKHSNKK